MYTRSRLIHIKVSPELLAQIDEAARGSYQSRSAYIRESIALRLNSQTVVDNQKTDDKWQAIIDQAVDAATQGYE